MIGYTILTMHYDKNNNLIHVCYENRTTNTIIFFASQKALWSCEDRFNNFLREYRAINAADPHPTETRIHRNGVVEINKPQIYHE